LPAADESGMAQLHKPVRRSDDHLRRDVRRNVPLVPPWPRMDLLLDIALSQHDDGAAEFPQPVGLGRVRGLDVLHYLSLVLVHRDDSRSRYFAGPRGGRVQEGFLRRPRFRMAGIFAPLAAAPNGLPA